MKKYRLKDDERCHIDRLKSVEEIRKEEELELSAKFKEWVKRELDEHLKWEDKRISPASLMAGFFYPGFSDLECKLDEDFLWESESVKKFLKPYFDFDRRGELWNAPEVFLGQSAVLYDVCQGGRSKLPCTQVGPCAAKYSFQLEIDFKFTAKSTKAFCKRFEECKGCRAKKFPQRSVEVRDWRLLGHPVCVKLTFGISKCCKVNREIWQRLELDERSKENKIRFTKRLAAAVDGEFDKNDWRTLDLPYISEAAAIPYNTLTHWRRRRADKVYKDYLRCKANEFLGTGNPVSTCFVSDEVRSQKYIFVIAYNQEKNSYHLQSIYDGYEWDTIAAAAAIALPETEAVEAISADKFLRVMMAEYHGARIPGIRLENIVHDYAACCLLPEHRGQLPLIREAYTEVLAKRMGYRPTSLERASECCVEEKNTNRPAEFEPTPKVPACVAAAIRVIAKRMSVSSLPPRQLIAQAVTLNGQIKYEHIRYSKPDKMIYKDYYDYIKDDEYLFKGLYGAEVCALARDAENGLFEWTCKREQNCVQHNE